METGVAVMRLPLYCLMVLYMLVIVMPALWVCGLCEPTHPIAER